MCYDVGMKIPVGYTNKPVYKVDIGDVVYIYGEVLDWFEDEERGLYFDKKTEKFISRPITITFKGFDGLPEQMYFGFDQRVRVLRHATVGKSSRPRPILQQKTTGEVLLFSSNIVVYED